MLKSIHLEVRNAKIVSAVHRQFKNGTNHIILTYSSGKKNFKGILNADLKTFIFNEVSFESFVAETPVEEKIPEK